MAAPQTIDPPRETRETRRTVAGYRDYAAAERAVDWLSDEGFAVERIAIVGRGLRSVEQVSSRMSTGRAALAGLGEGALLGTLFALLFGVFFTGPGFGGLLVYSVVAGGLFGSLLGAVAHIGMSGGRRDFISETSTTADLYEVQADESVADRAERMLGAMLSAR